uniref:Uncharacterized protein n=1 Tax=Sinocyclocheilus rhinocerous TaxID=307959 RepID=A0A673GRT1_9TELE
MAWYHLIIKKSVIVTSLIVVVSLFLVVINYSEKPYFLLQPVFGQCFSRNWMFSHPPHKAFKPHRGYLRGISVSSVFGVPVVSSYMSLFNSLLLNLNYDSVCPVSWLIKHFMAKIKLYLPTDTETKDFIADLFKRTLKSGSYLSTGWFTLILAMDMCKEIRVYGMINDTYCKSEGYRKVPYHYYEAGSRDECAEYLLHESAPYGGHRFITEKAVFAKWAKTHPIKFFSPEWQLL